MLQAPDKPPGWHEEDGVWGRCFSLPAVWGAAGLAWGQLRRVWGLQKGSNCKSTNQQLLSWNVPKMKKLPKQSLNMHSQQQYLQKQNKTKTEWLSSMSPSYVQNMCTKCGTQCGSRTRPVWLCKICREQREVRAGRQKKKTNQKIKETDCWASKWCIDYFPPEF